MQNRSITLHPQQMDRLKVGVDSVNYQSTNWHLNCTYHALIKCTLKCAIISIKGMYYTNRQGRLSLSSPNLKSIWYLQKQISKSNLRSTHFTKMRETEA